MTVLFTPHQLDQAEATTISFINRVFAARDAMGIHLHNVENMRAAARYTFATLKSKVALGEITSMEQVTGFLLALTEQTLRDLSNDEAKSMTLQTSDQGRKDQKQLYDMRRAECGGVMDCIAQGLGIGKSFQAACKEQALTVMSR